MKAIVILAVVLNLLAIGLAAVAVVNSNVASSDTRPKAAAELSQQFARGIIAVNSYQIARSEEDRQRYDGIYHSSLSRVQSDLDLLQQSSSKDSGMVTHIETARKLLATDDKVVSVLRRVFAKAPGLDPGDMFVLMAGIKKLTALSNSLLDEFEAIFAATMNGTASNQPVVLYGAIAANVAAVLALIVLFAKSAKAT